MKIEDLINKEDSTQLSGNNKISSSTGSKRIKIEDLLNKEDSINTNSNKTSNSKLTNDLSSLNKKENSESMSINNLAESNKNNNSSNILSKGNSNNDIKPRSSRSDSIGSASVMSHDSTISNAHISIVQGTKQLVGAAELFTDQWNEGKILSEDAKEKKEMLDEIIDLPDKNVFKLMTQRLNWEHNNAFSDFIRKRNMPMVPQDKLIEMANAGFNETMSNKDEKKKF
jgi:hypothetical protein